LRWQIAGWYSLLLLAVIVGVVAIISTEFQSILYAEAKAQLDETMQDVQRTILPPTGRFALTNSNQLQNLESPDNLERWASLEMFLQVNDRDGRPLAKSFNMASGYFPFARGLTPKKPASLQTATMAGVPYLIESRLLQAGSAAIVLEIGEPLDEVVEAFAQTRRAITVILAAAAAVVVLLSTALAARIANAINQLTLAMRETNSDLLDKRMHWKGRRDEIGSLAEAFDDLIARLRDAFARERQFLADASHELRTPLTSINANASMLTRWADRDAAIRSESLATIVKESSALSEMVDRMLTLARADAGEVIIREPLSLATIGAEAAGEARARAQAKGLTIEFEGDGTPVTVNGDAALLRQIFRNLLDNAIKFTPAGRIRTRVCESGDEAIIEVEDTGPGISADDAPHIFDRFYRSDRSRSRELAGTGLGLAIVRSIVRVHGGTVVVERASSGGAVFRIRLQLYRPLK